MKGLDQVLGKSEGQRKFPRCGWFDATPGISTSTFQKHETGLELKRPAWNLSALGCIMSCKQWLRYSEALLPLIHAGMSFWWNDEVHVGMCFLDAQVL